MMMSPEEMKKILLQELYWRKEFPPSPQSIDGLESLMEMVEIHSKNLAQQTGCPWNAPFVCGGWVTRHGPR